MEMKSSRSLHINVTMLIGGVNRRGCLGFAISQLVPVSVQHKNCGFLRYRSRIRQCGCIRVTPRLPHQAGGLGYLWSMLQPATIEVGVIVNQYILRVQREEKPHLNRGPYLWLMTRKVPVYQVLKTSHAT